MRNKVFEKSSHKTILTRILIKLVQHVYSVVSFNVKDVKRMSEETVYTGFAKLRNAINKTKKLLDR